MLATGVITADDLVGPLDGADLSDLIEEMRSGNTYVNVHTEAFGGGEIRGQIDSTVLGPSNKGQTRHRVGPFSWCTAEPEMTFLAQGHHFALR